MTSLLIGPACSEQPIEHMVLAGVTLTCYNLPPEETVQVVLASQVANTIFLGAERTDANETKKHILQVSIKDQQLEVKESAAPRIICHSFELNPFAAQTAVFTTSAERDEFVYAAKPVEVAGEVLLELPPRIYLGPTITFGSIVRDAKDAGREYEPIFGPAGQLTLLVKGAWIDDKFHETALSVIDDDLTAKTQDLASLELISRVYAENRPNVALVRRDGKVFAYSFTEKKVKEAKSLNKFGEVLIEQLEPDASITESALLDSGFGVFKRLQAPKPGYTGGIVQADGSITKLRVDAGSADPDGKTRWPEILGLGPKDAVGKRKLWRQRGAKAKPDTFSVGSVIRPLNDSTIAIIDPLYHRITILHRAQ